MEVLAMSDVSPKEFGALEADVRNLMQEIHLLRQDMKKMQATIDQAKGGIWVVMSVAGVIGSALTLGLKRLFGG
jgi:DNA anti-recombination protein RmuC